jgi:hypothetical protein
MAQITTFHLGIAEGINGVFIQIAYLAHDYE